MHIVTPASCITYTGHHQEAGSQAFCLQLAQSSMVAPAGLSVSIQGELGSAICWQQKRTAFQSKIPSRHLLLIKRNNSASS